MADDPALIISPTRRGSFASKWSGLILGLIALLYVGTCFTPVIFDDNEGLYAGAVKEMRARGDWLVPMSNGFPRVQKPPLVYWAMLISTSALGENEFALRLPNALATVGWIVATYLIARRIGGEQLGVAAALILASMLGVWVFTHLIQPEPFLACFVSLALWCLVEARIASGVRAFEKSRYIWFWIFLALGTMSKGLHGALWPLGTALLTGLAVPSWRPWLRPLLDLRGMLLFALIVCPWYAYMAIHFPGFLHAHFVNEQLGASLNTRYPIDAKQLPIWQFYLQHLLFWLPWTLVLPASLYLVLEKRAYRMKPSFNWAAQRHIIQLLAGGTAVVMVSVAFSTRQDYYSMACWGMVAVFLSWPWMEEGLPRWFLVIPCGLVGLAGLCALGVAGWAELHLVPGAEATAAPMASRDTFMDAITGISPALWAQFVVLLGVFGFVAVLAGGMACALAWRGRYFAAVLVLAGSGVAPICLATAGFTIMSPYFSLAENARAINRERASQPSAVVACEALPNTASSLLYYLNARVHWVNAPFDNQYAQRVLKQGRDYYWDEGTLEATWHAAAPLYFIVEESRLSYWQARLPGGRVVNKSGTRVVLCNR